MNAHPTVDTSASVFTCRHPSPLGELTLVASATGVRGVYFAEHRHFSGPGDWRHDSEQPLLRSLTVQLDAYFAGSARSFSLPLEPIGTPFQQRVWAALCALEFGSTVSYTQLAHACGKPNAVRAVASAIGRNPISMLILCHRVLGSNGALTGYAGGIPRKQFLLALEQHQALELA